MNSWDIEKRIAVLKEKMLVMIGEMALEYKNGTSEMTKEQFTNLVFHTVNEFYRSIGSPRLQVIEAWGPPYSEDHNAMISQILYDLDYLTKEVESTLGDLSEVAEQVKIEEEAFLQRIKDIENHIEQVVSKITTDIDVNVFRDHFGTTKFFNIEGSNPPAHISTSEQMLTLRKNKEESFNEYAKIRVLKGNGFPGNTKLAYATGEDIIFEGENGLRTNLAEVLDRNIDTWFEYESVLITDDTYSIYEAKGFEYDETLFWAKRTPEPLRLVVQLEFEKERLMNWVSFIAHIPYSKGSIAPIIEKVVVEDSSGKFQGYGFEEAFNYQKAYMVGEVACKRITLYLRQDVPYDATIGHPYFINLPVDFIATPDDDYIPEGTRVHGRYPSIQNLEVSYDKGLKEVVYPTLKYGDVIEDEMTKKMNLFTPGTIAATGETVTSGIELINAKRYAIGIKDVNIQQNQFDTTSVYISYPYEVERPIQEISLESRHMIPEIFGEGEWIRYYISIDSGNTWHQIYDQVSSASEAKIKYFVNSNTPNTSRLDEYGYLETGQDVKSVMLKIELSRPKDSSMNKYSPIVYGYELKVLA